jgi:hypothetical protein
VGEDRQTPCFSSFFSGSWRERRKRAQRHNATTVAHVIAQAHTHEDARVYVRARERRCGVVGLLKLLILLGKIPQQTPQRQVPATVVALWAFATFRVSET